MKNILEKYHYKKITQEREFNLLQTRHNSLSKMLTKSIASEIEEVGSETYIIVYNYDIIGFFTIKVSAFEDMDNFKIKSFFLCCLNFKMEKQLFLHIKYSRTMICIN